MLNYATSKQLIKNTQRFLKIDYYSIFHRIVHISGVFYGWGRKKSGFDAVALSQKHHTSFILLEDGFIRSIGLGVEGSPAFSLVEDDVGIYYDATAPSKLERILNGYDFANDPQLMERAREAMALIREHHISKYNHAPLVDEVLEKKYALHHDGPRVLIVAQTAGDSSLEYGMAGGFTTGQIIREAMEQNPGAKIFIKIHPDVLSGKKRSDIRAEDIPPECVIIDEDVNPISLLNYFDRVYTKTSGMGMEALILGKEVHTYGMPYYAGWGLTVDKLRCERRERPLTIEELFAGAYILYTRYYNPYQNRPSDILDTIGEIVRQKESNR
jgi:capsular polysaccharide export protein